MHVNGHPPLRARLADVAAEAAVSKSIASRILNGYPGVVREETRQRVLDAARRLEYSPSAAALTVAGAQTGSLAFLVPPLTSPVYVRIVRGAFRAALQHDLVVLLIEDLDPAEATSTLLRLIRSGRVDGVLMASARPRHPLVPRLRDAHLPHVFVNRAVPRSGHNVVMDDAKASQLAWRHLWELGHRKVGLLAGPSDIEPARRREKAFRRAAEADGCEVVVEHVPFTEDGGAQGMTAMLSRHPLITAAFTNSMSQAVGALGAAGAAGIRVPERLSVIAYDDMTTADYLSPPLTTVRMPLAELGAAAVAAIVAQLDGKEPMDQVIETNPEVVIRRSTAAPRPDDH